ncbi:MAG: MFS transporter [Alphaproteobacteria bacterium]|nr:MFS transporter [Alphaproteobacteria bacterium]
MSAPSSPPLPPLPPEDASLGWRGAVTVYFSPPALRLFFLGFSAGLPLLLVLGTLSFRLREAGIDRATIGFLSWVGLAYAFKWAWAPLVDRMRLPLLHAWLGRRRSWLLLAQAGIISGLFGMATTDPQQDLSGLVFWALVVAFGSATQDIALDAYRIESASVRHQAALAATYQTGYRLAMIWAGAGVLWLAATAQTDSGYQHQAWCWAYLAMAASMAVGCLTVLVSPEPKAVPLPPTKGLPEWLREALVAPFAEFIQRHRWHALLILGLIGIYRISDVVMGIMANPFYVDMGYTKEQVAAVSKVFGVIMTLLGAFIGGVLSMRLGIMRILMLGAVLSAVSNLLFAWLAQQEPSVQALVWIVSADNLSGGIASAAFIAYLSSLTQVQYSATQYALFSSMMLLAPKWLAGFSGVFVDAYGYPAFFTATALLGVPVLILVHLAAKIRPH